MNFKTDDELIQKAQAMGEEFAKLRCRALFTQFLSESKLADELYQGYEAEAKLNSQEPRTLEKSFEFWVDDYHLNFGHVIALAYAMGHIDSAQNIRCGTYREKPAESPVPEAPLHLIMPGKPD